MRQQSVLDLLQRNTGIEIGRLVHHYLDVRMPGGRRLDGVLPIGEEVRAHETADGGHPTAPRAGCESVVQEVVEMRGTLHRERRGDTRRVVRISAHRDVD